MVVKPIKKKVGYASLDGLVRHTLQPTLKESGNGVEGVPELWLPPSYSDIELKKCNSAIVLYVIEHVKREQKPEPGDSFRHETGPASFRKDDRAQSVDQFIHCHTLSEVSLPQTAPSFVFSRDAVDSKDSAYTIEQKWF